MKFRVDRADSTRVPCGMNSILYLGDSWSEARRVYAHTEPGRDMWNQPNERYGVILSVWAGQRLTGDYIVKCSKGLPRFQRQLPLL